MERTSTLCHWSASCLLTHPDFSSVNMNIFLHTQQPLVHISSPTLGFLCWVYTFIRKKSANVQVLDYKERKTPSWTIPERKAYLSLHKEIWITKFQPRAATLGSANEQRENKHSTSIKMVSGGEVFGEANLPSVSCPRVTSLCKYLLHQVPSMQIINYIKHKIFH